MTRRNSLRVVYDDQGMAYRHRMSLISAILPTTLLNLNQKRVAGRRDSMLHVTVICYISSQRRYSPSARSSGRFQPLAAVTFL